MDIIFIIYIYIYYTYNNILLCNSFCLESAISQAYRTHCMDVECRGFKQKERSLLTSYGLAIPWNHKSVTAMSKTCRDLHFGQDP